MIIEAKVAVNDFFVIFGDFELGYRQNRIFKKVYIRRS